MLYRVNVGYREIITPKKWIKLSTHVSMFCLMLNHINLAYYKNLVFPGSGVNFTLYIVCCSISQQSFFIIHRTFLPPISTSDHMSREKCSIWRHRPFSPPADTRTSQVKQGLCMAKAESKHFISHLKIIITWLSVIKRRSLAAACPVSNHYCDGCVIPNELICRLSHFND